MMKVIMAVPGEKVKEQSVPGGMASIKALVGGSLECIQLGNGFILYGNSEGNQQDLPVNPHFAQGIVKGNFVIARKGEEGESMGLCDDDIRFVKTTFIRSQQE